MPLDAKIKVVKKDNPFTEGTKVYKRVAAVLASRTVEQALKKGARRSTVHWMKAHRLIQVSA
jgi:hypothetical protein